MTRVPPSEIVISANWAPPPGEISKCAARGDLALSNLSRVPGDALSHVRMSFAFPENVTMNSRLNMPPFVSTWIWLLGTGGGFSRAHSQVVEIALCLFKRLFGSRTSQIPPAIRIAPSKTDQRHPFRHPRFLG